MAPNVGGGESQVVTIAYAELSSPHTDLSAKLEAAWGPEGLGVLTVSGVPGFSELRQRLLPLAARVAHLSPEAKARVEDPGSLWNFGWSEGKEQLESGGVDQLKGSYYANPRLDEPTADAALKAAFPSYCRPNLWPREDLPELEPAFKALGQLIIEVGCLLAGHADAYLARQRLAPPRSLRDSISESPCPKGRLLHYFAQPPAAGGVDPGAAAEPGNWCGWHLDHGSLTGLCSAMYLDAGLSDMGAGPDPAAGLYARARRGDVVRVPIPADHLAFQVGEAWQVQSGGLLQATPHCVVAPHAGTAAGISRNTFAVFMQPKWDEKMQLPAGCDAALAGVGQWAPGLTFGQFSECTFAKYYSSAVESSKGAAPADTAAVSVHVTVV